LLYWILKPIFRLSLILFYKIKIKNGDYLKANEPVILAINHTNAFMDPTIIGTYTSHAQHYLARGDVAGTAFKRWLLGKQLRIMPIYRFQEATDLLHKNGETFALCAKLLQQQKSIIIFPEGICMQEPRLQKLKKGMARIAFGAEEEAGFKLNLKVIPIGLNYADQRKFRSKLFINIGEPIYIADYLERYKTDKVRAINNFTTDLEDKMRGLIVSVADPVNDNFTADLLEVYRPVLMEEFNSAAGDLEKEHQINQEIVKAVNYFNTLIPDEIASVKNELATYQKSIRSFQLRDHLLQNKAISSMNTISLLNDYFSVVLGAPLHLVGLITNYPPYRLGYTLAKKIAKKKEFHASVCIVIATFTWLFYYAIQLLAIALVFRNYFLLAVFTFLIPLLGFFSMNYYMRLLKIRGRWRLLMKLKTDGKTIEQLLLQRYAIITKLGKLKEIYCRLRQ
jgi:glycerol-3-phosphate O-acyltransferase / dihydroxyacetone phosphate acyltransferase